MTIFFGTVNSDVLTGGTADDEFVTSAGNDTIDGGAGLDWLNFSNATQGTYMELYAGTVSQDGFGGHDTVANVENVIGSIYDDLIVGDDVTGGAYNNILIGLGGNDAIYGRAGDDYLRGDAGNDYLDGQSGNDGVYYYAAAGAIWVDLAAGKAFVDGDGGTDTIINVENVQGSDFNDWILGDAGDNKLDGYEGNDDLWGRAGNDYLDGGEDTDTAWYTGSPAAVTVNLATGTAADGFGGTDTIVNVENIHGGAHDDTLTGNGGRNDINGDGGNDRITGGGGDDILTGMGGADTFHFNVGDGVDNVIDYAAGTDFLEFSSALYSSAADVLTHAQQIDGSTVISKDGSIVVLDYVPIADLAAHLDHVLIV